MLNTSWCKVLVFSIGTFSKNSVIGKNGFWDLIALTETDFDSNEVVCHKEGAIKEFLWFEANLLVDKELGNLLYKGQLISKCFLVPSISPKKRTKTSRPEVSQY